MRWLPVLAAVAALGLVPSCLGPAYRVPAADGAAVTAERRALLRAAVDTALARRGRVYDLAWPVLTQNVDLCPEPRPSIGIVLADRPMLARLAGGLRDEDLAEIGYAEDLVISHVMAGGPAESAGLSAGTVLRSVNGEAVSAPVPAAKAIRTSLEKDRRVTLRVSGKEDDETVTVTPTAACDLSVKISTSQALNAHALTGDIVIFTGAIRSLGDEALQFLVAHEAAHLIVGHRNKYLVNLGTSGGFLTVPVLYGLGRTADMGISLFGADLETSLTTRALRLTLPWTEAFEAEADYVGLYLYARAGGDLTLARELFDVFAREAPSSIHARATHPLPAERLARAAATIAEIEALRCAGLPLVPVEQN